MRTEKHKDIARLIREGKPIDEAMNAAVRQAVRKHKQAGQPLVAFRDGKTVLIPPDQIVLDEDKK